MVDDLKPRYTTKRLRQEIERARENDARHIAALEAQLAELAAENERLTRLNKGLHDEVQFMRKAAKENRERHQEPVAWRYRYNGKWYVCDSESFARSGWDVTPLYTHPSEQAVTVKGDSHNESSGVE